MRTLQLHTIALLALSFLFTNLFAQGEVELNEIDCTDLINFEEVKVLPHDNSCNCDYRLEYVFSINGNPQDFFTSNVVDINFKIDNTQSNFEFSTGQNEILVLDIDLTDLANHTIEIPVNVIPNATIIHIPDDIELVGSIEFVDSENYCLREYSHELVEMTTTIIQVDDDGEVLALNNNNENTITIFDLIDWESFDCDENNPNYEDCKNAFLQSHGIMGESSQANTIQNGNQPILVETEEDDENIGSTNRETIINVDDIWGITKVYPNPNAHRKVYVNINDREIDDEINNLIIYDSKMNMIKAIRLNTLNNVISIEDLSAGLYFLQLRKSGKYSKITELLIY